MQTDEADSASGTGLRVVGAGLGRTGTASLKRALEVLLGGRCHHMLELHEHPAQTPVWTGAARGDMPHNDAVRAAVPPERLLEWSPGDGWEPICAALGLAVPDTPFPHTNTRDEFIARGAARTKR